MSLVDILFAPARYVGKQAARAWNWLYSPPLSGGNSGGGGAGGSYAPKPPDASPSLPTPPPTVSPPRTNPTPIAPPPPKNPYERPLPDPTGKPFPTIPTRKLPVNVDLKQKAHRITSQVSQSLAYRRYGCMLFSPVLTIPYTVYDCIPADTIEDIGIEQPNALLRLIGWLLDSGNKTLDELRANPLMDTLLNSLGVGDSIEDLLVDKVCDLALVGINFFSKGVGTSIIGRTTILYGCRAILQLALSYLERNQAGVGNLGIITNAYTSIVVVDCPNTIDPGIDGGYPDGIGFGCTPAEIEPTTVLLPDSGAFMNRGKYAILFWVLASDPRYSTYYTTWQIPDPVPALWDYVGEDGTIPPGAGQGLWGSYFAGIDRTQGYQFSRLYAQGRKFPIAEGQFSSKEDAEQCFDKILNFTTWNIREKAPFVHSSATEEEYLKVLSHPGARMILRKVNIVGKEDYKDSGTILVSYKAPPPSSD